MPWVEKKSRRGIKPGDRVMVPWPKEANPDPEAPMPYRFGTIEGESGHLKVRMDSGGVVDLPSKGFMAVEKEPEKAGGADANRG